MPFWEPIGLAMYIYWLCTYIVKISFDIDMLLTCVRLYGAIALAHCALITKSNTYLED
jgi:hypothetical protein